MWLRRLPTDRIVRRSQAPCDAPLIVIEPVKAALRVSALNDQAAALGLKPGMPLADARAMYPGIAVRDADHAADAAMLEAVADWCDRYTPLVGLDPPDGLLLDISGCAHLFGGERALGRDMMARLSRQGLQARLGLADTPGCAWAVARYGEKRLVPPGAAREILLPLPLTALRISNDTYLALAQAGLKRIADVVARPRPPLAARYGEEFLRRLDQALGVEEESIQPRLPIPAYMAERRFPDPIGREEDVLGALEQLAHELAQLLERRGEGARLLQAALFRADGKVYRIEASASEPLRDPGRIRRLFLERLAVIGDECDPGFGYDMVRLSALIVGRRNETQSGLGEPDHDAALAHLIDRLSARFGARRLTRPVPRDTHIPERAVAAVPAQAVRGTLLLDLMVREEQRQSSTQDRTQDSLAPARPVRLFQKPEPIEVINEVPDGAPARFEWRKVSYRVAAAEGPERIAMEWWDKTSSRFPRDYFRLESETGLRAWVFRQDFEEKIIGYEDHETTEIKPRWFLHGLLA